MSKTCRALAASLAVLFVGCAQDAAVPVEPAPAVVPAEQVHTERAHPDADAPAPDTRSDVAPAPAPPGFDIATLPVSNHPLGAFPFFSIPDGYSASPTNTRTVEFADAAFWDGHDITRVEGRIYAAGIRLDRALRGQKEFSDLEVVRNLQQVIVEAGGVEIAAGQTPSALRDEIFAVMRQYPGESTCYHNSERQVFVLRRADGNVWVETCRGRTHAGLVVAQEQALQVTSTLLPTSALEQALVEDGRVALQVHFATDSAEILAESLPQIEQVVELLNADPALDLSIEGHTDNTGDAARNRTLSQSRAESVVSAINEAGIAADRLDAAGHGDTRPVADNADEAGRARNRRVELVRRD